MSQQIGYDELLFDRVKQLKEIQDRLEDISRQRGHGRNADWMFAEFLRLRQDIAVMIRAAEEEHAAF